LGAPPLVLLHGLGATSRLNWFTSFPALEGRFRAIAPDLRGHGHGLRTAERFTIEDAADDVMAIADALGVDRFIPVGHSLGGPVAQLLWRRHPERIAGLVMCAYRLQLPRHTSRVPDVRDAPGARTALVAPPGCN
jgi:3-oxoadipate enol-lactonase